MTRAVLNQFASLTNPTLPNLDIDFLGVANTLVVPCTATGTNAITLTPLASTVTVSAYSDKDQYTFVAAATSTGVMTLQVNALGLLKLFKAGGTTQASTGDVVNGQFYQIAFQSALDSGNGGFVIVSAVTAVSAASGTPASGYLLATASGAALTSAGIITGVSRQSQGNYLVTFSSLTSANSYVWMGTPDFASVAITSIGRSASSINVASRLLTNASGTDSQFSITIFGS